MLKTKYNFTEIFKLKDMLDKANIKYIFKDETSKDTDGEFTSYHIWVIDEEHEKYGDFIISIIQNFGSFGREEDLL